MITVEDYREIEEHLKEHKDVVVSLAPNDNDRWCSQVKYRCDCKKVSKFPIYPLQPVVLEKMKCPVCKKINKMVFINLNVN